jgi:tetratricopeptide (TPR) repeat protein
MNATILERSESRKSVPSDRQNIALPTKTGHLHLPNPSWCEQIFAGADNVASIKETRPSTGDFDSEELFALARLDLKKGEIGAALAKLKQVTAEENAPAGAYSVCGHVYLQLELPARAERMFQKHLALHPGAPDETFFVGSMHYQAGRNDEAMETWSSLLKKYPSYTPALLYRAMLLSQNGQIAAARADLETLMKSTPVENPYFKPAKELMQRLDARHPDISAQLPAHSYGATTLAANAYKPDSGS